MLWTRVIPTNLLTGIHKDTYSSSQIHQMEFKPPPPECAYEHLWSVGKDLAGILETVSTISLFLKLRAAPSSPPNVSLEW